MLDRDYLAKSDKCIGLLKEDPTYYDSSIMEPFSASSPFYSIGSKSADKSISSSIPEVQGLQNGYLYCMDYALAETQASFKGTKYDFSYSFNATATFTGYSINGNGKNYDWRN